MLNLDEHAAKAKDLVMLEAALITQPTTTAITARFIIIVARCRLQENLE